jgi:hypothetical protein
MGSFVCSCAVGVCGSLGGNGGDLGAGRGKNSSVIVACRVRMGFRMVVERFESWVSTRGCGMRVGCLGFSDGIFFGF